MIYIMYSFHHVALSVTDRERSIAFYQKLDFNQVHSWEADDKSLSITHLRNGSMILELFCYRDYQSAPDTIHATTTDLLVIGTKHFGLQVDSIEQAKEELIKQGIADPDTTITTGRTGPLYFFIKDPDGILVEIMEDKRKFWDEQRPA